MSNEFFFFNGTATTEIYTLSLHDALPISPRTATGRPTGSPCRPATASSPPSTAASTTRSEEHTSELQSQFHLVCRLLLEKKKKPELANTRLKLIDRPGSFRVFCTNKPVHA